MSPLSSDHYYKIQCSRTEMFRGQIFHRLWVELLWIHSHPAILTHILYSC